MRDTLITDSIEEAAAVLRRGGTVGFPTETVYGLGAIALDETAVGRVFEVKGRPPDNPLIVHIADQRDVESVAAAIPAVARELMAAFFPGPLTLVLPKRAEVPDAVTAGLQTVAIRMPAHGQAQALIAAAGTPLVAPSANRSGRPSPTTWQAVQEDLGGRIDAILRGAPTQIGLESTVVDVADDAPRVLRPGAVTLEDLQRVAPGTRAHRPSSGERVHSPGLRHRHYAPAAEVRIVLSPDEAIPAARAAYIGLRAPAGAFELREVCTDAEDYARRLYDFFRRCDAAGVSVIYAEAVPEHGIGRALTDRLQRAAERPA